MRKRLPLDDIRVCYHVDGDRCACRKPQPGKMYPAPVARQIQLPGSYMIGDRWRDIGAGKAAGCTTILVNSFPEESAPRIGPDIELPDLPAAAEWILQSAPSLTGAAASRGIILTPNWPFLIQPELEIAPLEPR